MTKQYSSRLYPEDGAQVDHIVKAEDRTSSNVIRMLVHEALEARKAKTTIVAGDSRP